MRFIVRHIYMHMKWYHTVHETCSVIIKLFQLNSWVNKVVLVWVIVT